MITVCIKIDDEGKIRVGEETEMQETPTENPVDEYAQMAEVDSIDKALSVAKGLLESSMPDGGKPPVQDDDAVFDAGQASVTGGGSLVDKLSMK